MRSGGRTGPELERVAEMARQGEVDGLSGPVFVLEEGVCGEDVFGSELRTEAVHEARPRGKRVARETHVRRIAGVLAGGSVLGFLLTSSGRSLRFGFRGAVPGFVTASVFAWERVGGDGLRRRGGRCEWNAAHGHACKEESRPPVPDTLIHGVSGRFDAEVTNFSAILAPSVLIVAKTCSTPACIRPFGRQAVFDMSFLYVCFGIKYNPI